MKASSKAIDLIKKHEGFRSKPYLCPAGIPTIGYGSTRYKDGTRVRLEDPSITEEEALSLLEHQVNSEYGHYVDIYTTGETYQNQFDAMTSFAYNVGVGNLKSSTLLRKHNAIDFEGAAKEFDKWIHSNGKVLQGLVKRRAEERKLYEGKI